ncbi:DHA1 family bicyclomycin/chloramphenicol resistance-like MFS transporter [Catenuloplanes nepalensis]|uniref:DHA1 family bicyclomycin/chloramphenicol resistance-like MFS transporter n=1 Tax=Catenuloplanes nepalensis TaxID=587533 RepID=A0ABT9MXS0_9ACTN|nr:multidrug effflux MFS transporter [Catenuloplanes nepalensis]MDP9796238.1 DHA1 family bicyclomycin/chloramphenicol resistance-like MFS transporter [Catenuloplanes nepalensis]
MARTTVGTAVAPPRGRGALALVALLGTLTAIGPLSIDMYLPAFPEIAADLNATPSQVQLSLTTLMVGMAVGQLVTGPLSDRLGRRTPVIIGMVAYALLCVACAFAPSTGALAAVRFAQGFAGGMGTVVARAVVGDLYSGRAAAKYFSQLALVFGVAPVLAPSLGTLVLTFTDWRGIFGVLAAVAVLITIAVIRVLPETLPAERRSTRGLADVAETTRVLAKDKIFIGYAVAGGLAMAGLFAYLSGSSFVLQDVFGLSTAAYGILFGVNAVGLVAASQLNGRLLDRWSPRQLLVTSLAAGAVTGAALLAASALNSMIAVCVLLFCFMATIGMVNPNSAALALDRHRNRAGTSAALLGTVQTLIGAAAAPLVGLGGESSAVPMALVIAVCATLSLLTVATVTRSRPTPT